MGARLTDKKKKKILADYINNNNLRETARINNVAPDTVRRIVLKNKDNEDFKRKSTQKKEENTRDILKYMDSIYEKQKNIIDLSLSALEKKLKKTDMFTNVKDIATVYGVIFDKALKYKEIQIKSQGTKEDELDKVKELLNKITEEANK